MIILHLILHSTVHVHVIYYFSRIQNVMIILSRVFNKPIQWPAPNWLVSLIIGRVLHRYCRGQGFESCTSLNFFQGFFSQLQKLHIQLRWSYFINSFYNCRSEWIASKMWLCKYIHFVIIIIIVIIIDTYIVWYPLIILLKALYNNMVRN